YASDLGKIHGNRGLALADLGQREEAAQAHREAIKHQEAAFKTAPQVTGYRQALGQHHLHLGDVLRQLGRPTEAAAAFAAVAKLWPSDGSKLYAVARDLALCVPLVGKGKAQLSPEEQAERQKLADQVVQVLGQAVRGGFRDAGKLRAEPAFEPVRDG